MIGRYIKQDHVRFRMDGRTLYGRIVKRGSALTVLTRTDRDGDRWTHEKENDDGVIVETSEVIITASDTEFIELWVDKHYGYVVDARSVAVDVSVLNN